MTGRQQLGVVAVVALIAAGAAIALRGTLRGELAPLGAGTRAPNFTAVTLGTPPHTRTLADYRGQVVLVNIWATWCAPCRAEMPSLERLYRAFGPRGLKIVAISIDDPGSGPTIRAFVKQYGLTFDVLRDPSKRVDTASVVQRRYQTTGVPETVVIGRDGVIRQKIAFATDWDSDATRRLITRLLAEPARGE